MLKLSKEKLNHLKSLKGYSNAKISELTGLQISTVDKIFSGRNENPNIKTLSKLCKLFNCAFEEFFETDSDDEYKQIVNQIMNDEIFNTLYKTMKQLSKYDRQAVVGLAERLFKIQKIENKE